MSNEAMIDNWLDWQFSDDYIWDKENKQWVYNDSDEHQQERKE